MHESLSGAQQGAERCTPLLPFHLKFFVARLKRRLQHWDMGALTIELPNGSVVQHTGSQPGPDAKIVVRRWVFFAKLFGEGESGLGRSYVDGDWQTPDLDAVLALGLINNSAMGRTISGSWISHIWRRMQHHQNANTRTGSRRNIAAHYDLGNDFYALWLDRDMHYSSAIFDHDKKTLEAAQARKLERVTALADIGGGESVLEIGCGWGGLARHLARQGVKAYTGVSLSREQLAYAEAQKDAATQTSVNFEQTDYRDVQGQFDRIVSIEMFEAVGERFWPVYFQSLDKLLKPGGTAVLQVITIREDIFESYKARPDFIQRYIFPGGMLPTLSHLAEHAAQSGFAIESQKQFGYSYAKTLRTWHERFQSAWPHIQTLGYDTRFQRMWAFYLKYCEAGFTHGLTDVGLYKLVRR